MSTTDNNKLLAEFLGWHSKKINITASRPKGEGIELYLKEVTEYNREFIEDELKFHTDWNWLMQVVEKIESLQFQSNNDVFKVVIDYGMCTIYNMINNLETIVNVSKSTKIEAVYNACVEFVKWYNTQEL
jgi:hypothetical protein